MINSDVLLVNLTGSIHYFSNGYQLDNYKLFRHKHNYLNINIYYSHNSSIYLNTL